MSFASHAVTASLAIGTLLAVVVGCGDDETLFEGDDAGGTPGAGGQGAGGEDAGGSATGGDAAGGDGSGGEATGGTGGGGTCFALGDPCTECEMAACAETYCDCFQNEACVALAQCAITCPPGDTECYQPCWSANPTGISEGALIMHCAATNCATQCPGYVPLSPCQECLYTACQPQMNTCVANPDCTELLYCLDACTTPGCENTCYSAHPGGLVDAGPVGTCLQSSCAAACG